MRFFRSAKRTAFALISAGFLLQAYAGGPEPSLSHVYPAGAQAGTVTRVLLAGQNVKDAKLVQVEGSGVIARIVGQIGGGGPLNNVEKEDLKEYLKARGKKDADKNPPAVPLLPDLPELRDLAAKNPEQLRMLQELFLNNDKMAKPPMNELVIVDIEAQKDAKPGNREIRLVNPSGISNPLVFQIGVLPEFSEAGPYEFPDPGRRFFSSVPAVGNGQIMPGEVDSWQADLKKGQRILVSCQARNLIPFIADAVPGWFQAVLSVRDANGRELAYADDWGSDPDPLLAFTAPADGRYVLEVRDSIYRGRYDFVYRLLLGDDITLAEQLPVPGSSGRGTSGSSLARTAAGAEASRILPGQPVTGTVSKPGETDSYAFQAATGQTLCARIKARTLGSPLDAVLRITDSKGTVIASNDDFEDKSLGLFAHHADPQVRVTFAEKGTYEVRVTDAARLGGEDYRYDLLLEPPKPDFSVLTRRSSLSVMAGSSAALWVQLVRRDGWDGEVELFLEDGGNLSLSGARIPQGKDSIQLTLDAAGENSSGLRELKLMARAVIEGKTVEHFVQAADLRMQAFGNTHLVQTGKFQVLVLKPASKDGGPRYAPEAAKAAGAEGGLVLVPGTVFTLPVNLKLNAGLSAKVQLWEAPAGLTLLEQKPRTDGLDLVFAVDAKLPSRDNLILDFTLVSEKPNSKPTLSALGTLPALPFRRGQ